MELLGQFYIRFGLLWRKIDLFLSNNIRGGGVGGVTKTVGKNNRIVKHNGKIVFYCTVDY